VIASIAASDGQQMGSNRRLDRAACAPTESEGL
jgi:hypothetical protein